MKHFIYYYIDQVTLGLALIFVSWLTISAWKRTEKQTRLGILPFLYLGPVLLLCCMFTHLFEIGFHALDTKFSGKFSLRFHLYSLVLMPLVMAEAGRRYLMGIRAFLFSEQPRRSMLLKPFGLLAILLFPVLWLNPLSYMMFFVFALSLGASFLVHKRKKAASTGMPLSPAF